MDHLLIAMTLLSPLAVLVHELGHAVAFLRCGSDRVRITLGRSGGSAVGAGRFELAFGWRAFLGEGSAQSSEPWSRRQTIVVAAAGPFASLVALLAGLAASHRFGWNVWFEAWAVVNAVGVANVVPFVVGDQRSDGRVILEALGLAGPAKPAQKAIRLPFLAALALIIPIAFVVDPILGLFLLVLVPILWSDSRVVDSDE